MKEIFKTIIKDWQKTIRGIEIWERKLVVPVDSNKIITLIGPRRSGKTYYAFQLINKLLAEGVGDRIVYINFEDERLEINVSHLHLILEAYYELYPDDIDQGIYFFFDEIQVVDGWEKFVRRLYDTVSKNIFLTGSSAKMLGKEIATGLRGRNLTYNLYPLSFEEFCGFQNVDLTDVHSTRAKAVLRTQVQKYLRFGGFPETAFMKEELILKTLQSYFDGMLFRDIVERHNISNVLVLKHFLKKTLNNIAQKFSVNKFYNELKSQGIAISKNAIYEFLAHSIDCFLLFVLYPFDPSIVRQQARSRKVYAIDTGLANAITYRYSEDKGKLLENMVFLHLLRDEKEIHYMNEKHECDFIVRNAHDDYEAIQVCLTLQDEATKQREIRGLLQAVNRFDLPEGFIITLDEEGEFEFGGKRIVVIPGWKWLLKK